MILLDRNGICVDIAVHNADLWFLKENQLLGRNILQLLPSVTYRQVYPEFKKVLAYKEVSARNYELTIGSETYFFKCIMRPYEDMVLCQYRDITRIATPDIQWHVRFRLSFESVSKRLCLTIIFQGYGKNSLRAAPRKNIKRLCTPDSTRLR